MKSCLLCLCYCFTVAIGLAQPRGEYEAATAAYLDSIRTYPAALRVFFQQMPKGGDLHHHLSGSVYAETYLDQAFALNWWIDPNSLQLSANPTNKSERWLRLNDWSKQIGEYEVRRRLLRFWSVLDYSINDGSSYDDFFDAFGRITVESDSLNEISLGEIKTRARAENVQYIETMFQRVGCDRLKIPSHFNESLLAAQTARDTGRTDSLLAVLFEQVESPLLTCARDYADDIARLHQRMDIDAADFIMRYQTYVIRNLSPVVVFGQLVASFQAAAASPLVVGVNIVAPEHHPIALRDYWLHMRMFRFCRARYPGVRTSLHAGELTLGLVKPEDLRWHIRAAVEVAGADRIGHGVDLAYETRPYALLDYMRENNIAVEINLSSNEFILKVAGGDHPFQLYHQAGVPLVISTDDAGVLRTDLTQQYVLLAQRYPYLSYRQIKQLVYNSVRYSFIEESKVRDHLVVLLDEKFAEFEEAMVGEK